MATRPPAARDRGPTMIPEKCQCGAPMAPRDPKRLSDEQRWCGTWFDCTEPGAAGMHSTRLVMSDELKASHAEQAARSKAPKQGNLF